MSYKEKTNFRLTVIQLISCLLESVSDKDIGDIEYYTQRIIDQVDVLERRDIQARALVLDIMSEVEDREPYSFEFEFLDKCKSFLSLDKSESE